LKTSSSGGEPAFPDDQQAETGGGGEPAFPDDQQAETGGDGEPAFPDDQQAESGTSGEPAFPDDQQVESGGSGEPAFPDNQQAETGGSGEPAFPGEQSPPMGGSESASSDSQLSDAEIQAVREAILTAGEALQTASEKMGEPMQGGGPDSAEGALADARVALIIAGQEIQVAIENGSISASVLADLEAALGDANLAIVLAGQILTGTELKLPGSPDSGADSNQSGAIIGQGGGRGRLETLDDELNESLVIFDGKMNDARSTIPEEDSQSPGGIIIGGTETSEQVTSSAEDLVAVGDHEEEAELGEMATATSQTGRMPESSDSRVTGSAVPDPEDIPDGQDDDIVARQLREAAMSEQDPELKEKLWEEYKKYKKGIGQ
jgi:hypothetical protein